MFVALMNDGIPVYERFCGRRSLQRSSGFRGEGESEEATVRVRCFARVASDSAYNEFVCSRMSRA